LTFGALVREHSAERDAKGFSCWTQFVSMLLCQLAHADSLREICNGLGVQPNAPVQYSVRHMALFVL